VKKTQTWISLVWLIQIVVVFVLNYLFTREIRGLVVEVRESLEKSGIPFQQAHSGRRSLNTHECEVCE
jgi:hypothetical protein